MSIYNKIWLHINNELSLSKIEGVEKGKDIVSNISRVDNLGSGDSTKFSLFLNNRRMVKHDYSGKAKDILGIKFFKKSFSCVVSFSEDNYINRILW